MRPYQNEAIDAAFLKKRECVNRQLVVLPTGTGKTIVFSGLSRRFFYEEKKTVVIIAHRDELIQQAKKKLHYVWPEARVGIVKGKINETENVDVVITSVQTASNEKRLNELRTLGFGLAIVDEAHHAVADSYQTVLDGLGFLSGNPEKLLFGVTATTQRDDGRGLNEIFEQIIYEKALIEMIRDGYLCDIHGIRIKTQTDISKVKRVRGDFAIEQLSEAINTPERNSLIVSAWERHASTRKTLAFCATVQHAIDLAAMFRQRGVEAAAVWGDMGDDERKRLLNAYAEGKIRVLANCALLTEGYDDPPTSALLIARPTRSLTLYTQMVGRGTRLAMEKRNCLVIDFFDNNHDVCTVGSLLGATNPKDTPVIDNEESLLSAYAKQERVASVANFIATDVYAEVIQSLAISEFKWHEIPDTKSGSSSFGITVGDGSCLYLKHAQGDEFRVLRIDKDNIVKTLTDEPLSLGYAMGFAEDWIRQSGTLTLTKKTASWRHDTISRSQQEALTNLGVTVTKEMTKGDASDLLSLCSLTRKAKAMEYTKPPSMPQLQKLRYLGMSLADTKKITSSKEASLAINRLMGKTNEPTRKGGPTDGQRYKLGKLGFTEEQIDRIKSVAEASRIISEKTGT